MVSIKVLKASSVMDVLLGSFAASVQLEGGCVK